MFNVEAEGRQKVEDCCQKRLVDEEKISLLEALGLGLFPWPLLKSIFIVKETLGAVFEVFWTSLGFAQSKFLRRSLVPGFYKTSTMALPGET